MTFLHLSWHFLALSNHILQFRMWKKIFILDLWLVPLNPLHIQGNTVQAAKSSFSQPVQPCSWHWAGSHLLFSSHQPHSPQHYHTSVWRHHLLPIVTLVVWHSGNISMESWKAWVLFALHPAQSGLWGCQTGQNGWSLQVLFWQPARVSAAYIL